VSPTTPDIGKLLASQLAALPEAALPGFLALLERGAAARYRQWAEQMPERAAGLLACAAREEEIADRIDAAFPLEPRMREGLGRELPEAREIYVSLFVGHGVEDQLAIQAGAERQGAAAWRGLAAGSEDPALRAVLEDCARLEEESAGYRESLAGADARRER
jgi:hypothetical protein